MIGLCQLAILTISYASLQAERGRESIEELMTGAGDHCRTHPWAYHVRIHRSRVMALDFLALADYSWSHLAHPVVQPRNLCTHNPCYARAASSQGKRQPQHFCTDRARASWSEADDH